MHSPPFTALLALAATLFLSSCLDYEEDLTIHEDLSGEAKVTLTLPDSLVSTYEPLHNELNEAKLAEKFKTMDGITLQSLSVTEGRKPVIKFTIKFSSLDKLNAAIEANKPASFLAGRFTVTRNGGETTIERQMGKGTLSLVLPPTNYANYKTHFDSEIIKTNSEFYNNHGQDVRYRYTDFTKLAVSAPTQTTTVSRPFPWLWVAAATALGIGLAWFGWQAFGSKKK